MSRLQRARRKRTPKMQFFQGKWPLLETFQNSVPKEFMTTPIHVLYSNFTEIVCREVGETMRCFGDKKVRKMRFYRRHFGGGHQKFAGIVARDWPYVPL